jgi:CRISPR-associated protein Cas1
MPILYIQHQGAIVRKRGARLLIKADDKILAEIPLRQTEAVAVFGNVQVTTQAMSVLLDAGIPLALHTRHGRLKGHLVPESSKNVDLRVAQFRHALDPAAALPFARATVAAKLRNTANTLAAYRRHNDAPELAALAPHLLDLASHTQTAASPAELMGIEGAGAAAWFAVLSLLNHSPFEFPGRRRRPPTDPINALLSLGYTFLLNELRALAEGAGLEPHVGFLHQIDYGRPSLALDLLEPFRVPVIDRLTLRLVNLRILTEPDFARSLAGPQQSAVILLPTSFATYVQHYESALTTPRAGAPQGVRALLRDEIAKLRTALLSATPFEPWQSLDDPDALRDLL